MDEAKSELIKIEVFKTFKGPAMAMRRKRASRLRPSGRQRRFVKQVCSFPFPRERPRSDEILKRRTEHSRSGTSVSSGNSALPMSVATNEPGSLARSTAID
ncbi:MAG TPA: hypothetical protein VIE43_26460 [Thermoanaerobaculia bacterium]|nr:hypothetical protein [Thermoanaerobaculia bacterium]